MTTTSVRAAAIDLRRAQKAYMADRGNAALGKLVGEAAERLDIALAATELSVGDINTAFAAWNEVASRGGTTNEAMHAALHAVNFPALRAAGLRLYMSARWSADRPVNEALLWEDFREALGLKPGTATKAGLGADRADEPPLPMFGATEGLTA